ncbi:cyclase family protein [Marinicella sp. W31]|uniref:cyclase family protein n=1 Tax=Marinicella sp. W31 TaxID=3023713 RepID=UPI0037564AFC
MTTLITMEVAGHVYQVNHEAAGCSIAITQRFDSNQPNHFGAAAAQKKVMQAGDFVGDTEQGGACNVHQIKLNPHCNGTHTETISHVLNQLIPPHQIITGELLLAAVITVEANGVPTDEHYTPELTASDQVINSVHLGEKLEQIPDHIQALIIRTLPNPNDKKTRVYGGDVQPPFFTHQAMKLISQRPDLKHLLVDMPSIDRMYDDGILSNHRIFWNIDTGCTQVAEDHHSHRTITEMVFVPDTLSDGLYGLNLQVPALALDAVPSNPILFEVDAI